MRDEELAAMERRARIFEAANEKILAEKERLREENARLRESLTLFAAKEPVQLTYEGRAFIKAVIVSESELAAARAAIQEGEKGDGKNN